MTWIMSLSLSFAEGDNTSVEGKNMPDYECKYTHMCKYA